MTTNVKKTVYGGLLIAFGILLPQAFHMFGSAAGQTFLPMHIPIILAGMILGPVWALGIAILVPILSSFIFSMPAIPMLWFMLFELATYAVVSGILAKKGWNVYLNLVVTILCGRTVYGLTLLVAVKLLRLSFPFASWAAFSAGLVKGWPGVVIQLIVIPLIMIALKKAGLLIGKR